MPDEDRLARVHREYREQCIKNGTYRPITAEELAREEQRWRKKCLEVNLSKARRRKNPKGTAD